VDGRDEPGHDREGGAYRRPDGYPAAIAPGLGVTKKSKTGIKRPQMQLDLIRERLKRLKEALK
jgi:hypothetical protein